MHPSDSDDLTFLPIPQITRGQSFIELPSVTGWMPGDTFLLVEAAGSFGDGINAATSNPRQGQIGKVTAIEGTRVYSEYPLDFSCDAGSGTLAVDPRGA